MYGAYASTKSKGQGTFELREKDTVLITPEPGYSLPKKYEPVMLVEFPPNHWRAEGVVLSCSNVAFVVGFIDKLDYALPA